MITIEALWLYWVVVSILIVVAFGACGLGLFYALSARRKLAKLERRANAWLGPIRQTPNEEK